MWTFELRHESHQGTVAQGKCTNWVTNDTLLRFQVVLKGVRESIANLWLVPNATFAQWCRH